MDELSSKGFSDVKASFKPDRVQVVVNAPFAEGRNAGQILDSHGPLMSDEDARAANEDPDPSPSRAPVGILSKVRDPATPLSDILGLRVLINDPAPLSNRLGWPTLFGSVRRAQQRPVAPPPDSSSKNEPASSGAPVGEGSPSRERRRPHTPP
jgi:hypothetical protein